MIGWSNTKVWSWMNLVYTFFFFDREPGIYSILWQLFGWCLTRVSVLYSVLAYDVVSHGANLNADYTFCLAFIGMKASLPTLCGCSTTHCGYVHTPLYLSWLESCCGYGSASYLRYVTGIWVSFMNIIKSKWSRHQSLDFSKCN